MADRIGETPLNPALDEALIGLHYAADTGGNIILKGDRVTALSGYVEMLERIALAAAIGVSAAPTDNGNGAAA